MRQRRTIWRDRHELVRCWDHLDVANGVGMLRMALGCEGESEGKREVKKKKKKKG